jgi:hypothetical protein
MSAFIALQDLCQKISPRAIAFEKSTGGLKILNDRFINVFIQVTDFKADFSVQAISSRGAIIHDKFLKFGLNFLPKVDVKTNVCSFNLILNCSSEKYNSFFYIVVSWLTNQGKVRFLVSSALVIYTKNTINDQPYDDHCSYVSFNNMDQDIIIDRNSTSSQFKFCLYLENVLLFSKRDLQPSYIVYQKLPLNLRNHRDAVSSAAHDIITEQKQLGLISAKTSYTVVQRVFQSITLEYSGSSEVLNTTSVETILRAAGSDNCNMPKISLEAGKLIFSLRGARSKAQLLGKRKNNRKNELVPADSHNCFDRTRDMELETQQQTTRICYKKLVPSAASRTAFNVLLDVAVGGLR